MGNLGSFALGFVTFMLTVPVPVRVEFVQYDCVAGTTCPSPVTNCYNVLGWENVLGLLGCSRWAAVGVALLVGLLVGLVGAVRARASRWLAATRPRCPAGENPVPGTARVGDSARLLGHQPARPGGQYGADAGVPPNPEDAVVEPDR